ncbi:hypothetical protein [Roseicyclus persicicus]|uniref:Uncharacterized protein n=1 Tax=Roseicyclus persicicus TaxID=2650661 RepID=A0A7X6JZ31_9RHOB|nr:hypothetical protein [Roseibacterium persicicum]NKX44383.1 hypothetical protein [Roseibacterium persicicum]
MLFLRAVANILFPAVAGFVITIQLLLPLSMSMFPALQPTALALIPASGLVTALLCLGHLAVRRLLARAGA